ncbi:reverse transcriptase domain-containing protein [Tanacetum coccineum]
MTGVPRHIAERRLNVQEGCLPIRQKKMRQAPKRNKATQEEVEKLVDAGIMKEVHYHSWLSNSVMVKKHDRSWRMCVDFKDLNQACPKDGYPLPEIDWKVEYLCGYPFKCFLDAYKGYHQIKMAKEDEEKTAFIMSQRIFCYSKMSFGLKNARATYQRLVDKAFQKQIGRNLEVYVDDLTREAEVAFKQMKKLIAELPMMTAQKEKRGANHVPSHDQGSYQRSLNDRKGGQENASILCEPRLMRARDQLHPYGKTGVSFAQCKQAAEKVWKSVQYGVSKELYMAYWAFLGVGTTFDIFQNIIFLFLNTAYRIFWIRRIDFIPFVVFDRSSGIDGSEAGLILTNPEGVEFTYAMGVKNLQANVDSRLVANQVNGSYVAKESGMAQYLEKVKMLTSNFKEFSIKQVPRSENKKADALSKIASTSFTHLIKQVLVEELKEKSIDEKEVLAIVEEEGHTWMTPIFEYLTKEILPEEKMKARAIRRKASSMHFGPRSVVAKAIWTRYYWPTMHIHARKLIRECNDCQVHHPIPRNPQQNLTPITSPWPFYKWGIDIARPFPEGPGKVKFLIVAVDYFTKWIEAKPVATITGNQVKKFV